MKHQGLGRISRLRGQLLQEEELALDRPAAGHHSIHFGDDVLEIVSRCRNVLRTAAVALAIDRFPSPLIEFVQTCVQRCQFGAQPGSIFWSDVPIRAQAIPPCGLKDSAVRPLIRCKNHRPERCGLSIRSRDFSVSKIEMVGRSDLSASSRPSNRCEPRIPLLLQGHMQQVVPFGALLIRTNAANSRCLARDDPECRASLAGVYSSTCVLPA